MWITQLFKKLSTVNNLDKLTIFLLITLQKLDIIFSHPLTQTTLQVISYPHYLI
jgi:hypothetical protein